MKDKTTRLTEELATAWKAGSDFFNYGARALCTIVSVLFLAAARVSDFAHDQISTAEEHHEAPVPHLGDNHLDVRQPQR